MMENELGARIRKLRRQKGYTQADLAGQLNVTDKAISKWEAGGGNPDISLLVRLAKILGVTVDCLLSGEVQAAPSEPVSSLEICCRNDDAVMFAGLNDRIILHADEFDHDIIHCIDKYKSGRVLDALLKRIDTFDLFCNDQHYRTNDFDPNDVMILLIKNGRYDILHDFARQHVLCHGDRRNHPYYLNVWNSRRMPFDQNRKIVSTSVVFSSIMNDEKTVNEFMNRFFTAHQTDGPDVVFPDDYEWVGMYDEFMKQARIAGNKKAVRHIHEIFSGINRRSIEEAERIRHEAAMKPNDQGVQMIRYLSKEDRPPFYTTCLACFPLHDEMLDFLYAGGMGDIVRQWNECNKIFRRVNQSKKIKNYDDRIRIEETAMDPKASRADKELVRYLSDGILDTARLAETNDLKLIQKGLREYPIDEYEKLMRAFEAGDRRFLFEYAFYHDAALTEAVLRSDELLQTAVMRAGLQAVMQRNPYGRQLIPTEAEKIRAMAREHEAKLQKKRSELLEQTGLLIDARSIISELSEEKLVQMMNAGDLEKLTIKLCKRLETVLRCRYESKEELHILLARYCDERRAQRDDESHSEPDSVCELLHRMRLYRNSLVHPGNEKIRISKAELRECIQHVCEIQIEGEQSNE